MASHEPPDVEPGCLWDTGDKIPRAFDTQCSIVLLEDGSSGCSVAGSLLGEHTNSLLYPKSIIAASG